MLKKTLFVISILTVLIACDSALEKDPLIGSTEDSFYQTPEDAEGAVNAAYAALQFELTPAGHFRWMWGDIMSDDAIKGGSGDNDVPVLRALENFQGPTNSDLLDSEWTADYLGINRANIVLEKVPAIEMDEQLKARFLAEARTLRSFYYFTLVTMFGDVPLIEGTLAPSEYQQPRAPASDVWAFIENDLLTAIPDLPLKSEYAPQDLGRVTKGTAQAMLLKTYVYQEKWQEAKAIGDELIATGEYSLSPDFAGIFRESGENGPGSVFEIQYMNASGGNWGYTANNEGTFNNIFLRARGQFEGFGFNIPTQDLVDEFFAEGFEDPRLSATVFREGDQMGDRGVFTKEATGGFPHDYYQRKIFNNKSEEAPFGDPAPNGGTNDRVIRYADVLLLYAEACYHTGNIAQAQDALNQVRERAGVDPITVAGQPLLDAIYRERRLELALEGHRFFDLVRTGRAADVLGPLGYLEGVHNVFPVPQSQIEITNGMITQNNGY